MKAAGQIGIPAGGVSAVVASVTVITPGSDGYLRVGPATSGSGSAGTINYSSGVTINDVVVIPVDSNGRIKLIPSSSVNVTIDVSGYLTDPAPGASTGAVYRPVSAIRALATNTGAGVCTPSPCARLTASSQVKVKVRGSGVGSGAIPADAAAVVAFVSVKSPAALGYMRIDPVGSGTGSTGSATINYNASTDSGMTVIAPVNSDDTITIAASSATDVIIDVSGYYQAASAEWIYHYDSAGVRDTKTDAAGQQTEFVYSGEAGLPLLLEQITASETQFVIYGPGGMPIEQVSSDGSAVWLHTDQVGSVRMTTAANAAAGTVGAQLRTQSFSAYGRSVATAGSGSSPRPILGFAGEYTDAESGLLYLRARHYDPRTGQFMSLDPLVASTQAAYSYAGNNPINGTDPSGMCGFLGDGACSLSGIKEDVEDICVKRGPNDEACETKVDDFKEDHPETAQHITNFAGGMLVLNPITTPFILNGQIDLAGHGVDASSGWFYTGLATMAVIDIAGYCAIGQEAGVMSHWGEESPWVMNGPATRLNWLKAGAAEPFESGVAMEAGEMSWPSGWQWFKGFLGQRILK